MVPRKKKTKGRQKIEMKEIEKAENKQITFSKRRAGIFKKANELITLCGAEVGIVVFSPAGKPFSFGHPSVESIANRFLNQNPPPNDNTHPLVEVNRKMKINELNQQYNEIEEQLEAEIEGGKMLDRMTAGKPDQGWWERPVDLMKMEQLKQFRKSLENLRSRVIRKLNEKLTVAAAPPPPGMPHPPAQMTNYPYGTNMGNDVTGPSYHVPGQTYGYPPQGTF